MSDNRDPRIEVIAKAIFTGILYGGSEADWEYLYDEEPLGVWSLPGASKNWYRCGAEDVIRALDGAS